MSTFGHLSFEHFGRRYALLPRLRALGEFGAVVSGEDGAWIFGQVFKGGAPPVDSELHRLAALAEQLGVPTCGEPRPLLETGSLLERLQHELRAGRLLLIEGLAPLVRDGFYTDHPNEVETKQTVPLPSDVVTMLKSCWGALNDHGARTLTAQFMGETGSGKHCYNWNLGNKKARDPSVPHMYLKRVWEVKSPGKVHSEVAESGGLGHIADEDECKRRGWYCPPDKLIGVFQPPHRECRFRAYSSLQEGAALWVDHHLRISRGHADYVALLNAANISGVAHVLKQAKYYTADEARYAATMQHSKNTLDRLLGAP